MLKLICFIKLLYASTSLLNCQFTGCFRYSTTMSDTVDKPMKAAPSHPPYLQLIKDAITEIGNSKGSSR